MPKTDDGIEYSARDLDGKFEIIYDAAHDIEPDDISHYSRTLVFAADGELLEDTMLIW